MKRENYYKFLYATSLLLIFGFIIRIIADCIKYNSIMNSAPFYVTVLIRLLEFILPSILIFVAARILKRKFN